MDLVAIHKGIGSVTGDEMKVGHNVLVPVPVIQNPSLGHVCHLCGLFSSAENPEFTGNCIAFVISLHGKDIHTK